MPAQTSFVPCVAGQWTQISEYRESRRSLIVSFLGGAAILGFRTDGPSDVSAVGIVPAGVFTSANEPNGPSVFRLSRELDGDLVAQAWFAWVVPGGIQSGLIAFGGGETNLPWIVPAGVTQISNIFCWGSGGVSGQPGGGLGGGGGGGGAFASSGPLPCLPGQIWLITTDDDGALGFSQVVNSSAVLVVQALSGLAGVADIGGLGGNGGLGVTLFAGGDGADATLLAGVGGGGGGSAGAFGAGTNAAGSVHGSGGGTVQFVPPAFPGFPASGVGGNGTDGAPIGSNALPGVSPGGGGGGPGDGLFGPNNAGLGCVIIQIAGVPQSPTVTVLEAFDFVIPPEKQEFFGVPLPRLSPDAIAALDDLLKRIGNKPENRP